MPAEAFNVIPHKCLLPSHLRPCCRLCPSLPLLLLLLHSCLSWPMVVRFKIMSTLIPPDSTLSLRLLWPSATKRKLEVTWDDSRTFSGSSGLFKPWKEATVGCRKTVCLRAQRQDWVKTCLAGEENFRWNLLPEARIDAQNAFFWKDEWDKEDRAG